jgi:hypothetical protein
MSDRYDADAKRAGATAAAIRFRLSALCQAPLPEEQQADSAAGLSFRLRGPKTTSSLENGTIPCAKLLSISPMTI